MNRLIGKRVVITGAASGLGRSLSTALAAKGCKLGIVDINDAGAEETLEMVKRAGGTGEVFHADVTVPADIKGMADHFFDAWGGVDLLINNAGVAVGGFIGDIPLEDWKWIFDVNYWGVLYGCHEFFPRMKAQGSGQIANVASSAGLLSLTEMAPYSITKAAVISLSEILRIEAAPHNVGVTAVCPMFFETNLLKDSRTTEEWVLEMANTAFRRARMTSDEVASRVLSGVEKNRLFVIPQLSGKVFWLTKRLMPETNNRIFKLLSKHGWLRSVMDRLARWGLIQ